MILKLAIVLFVIVVGPALRQSRQLASVRALRYTGFSFFGHTVLGQTSPGGEPVGMLAGAAIVFFAYIGFDSVSTHAEEARNPSRDVPIGIMISLVLCTVLYIAVAAVLTGMVPYNQINIDAPVSDAFRQVGLPWAQLLVSIGAVAGHYLGPAGDDAQPAENFPGHGARRPVAARAFSAPSTSVSARPGSPRS